MGKRQGELPGMEEPRIQEIDDAAEAYVKARDKRMKCTEQEVTTKTSLISLMEKHKLAVYKDKGSDPPLVVHLTAGKTSVKVTLGDAPAPEDSDDEKKAEAEDAK